MPPIVAVAEMTAALEPGTIVVDESITSTLGVRSTLKLSEPGTYFFTRGGGLGFGLPASIGVKLARPDRPVVAIVGDGTTLYTPQALWTMAHHQVPVVAVVLNNASYLILKSGLAGMQGKAVKNDVWPAMDLVDPRVDFLALSRAFDVPAERVETASDIAPAIRKAMASGGPGARRGRRRRAPRRVNAHAAVTEQTAGIEPRAARVAEAIANQDAFFAELVPRACSACGSWRPGRVTASPRSRWAAASSIREATRTAVRSRGSETPPPHGRPSPRSTRASSSPRSSSKPTSSPGSTAGTLRAEATSVHRGRRTMVLEVHVTTDDDERRPVAMMIVTQAILKTPGASGGEEVPPEG